LILHLGNAWQHSHDAPRPRSSRLSKLVGEIFKIELALRILSCAACLLGIDRFRGFLDERNDITMPRMRLAIRDGEILQRVHLLAGASSLIGLPVTARMESAAPRAVTIDSRQHDAVMPTRSSKLFAR